MVYTKTGNSTTPLKTLISLQTTSQCLLMAFRSVSMCDSGPLKLPHHRAGQRDWATYGSDQRINARHGPNEACRISAIIDCKPPSRAPNRPQEGTLRCT